MATYQFPNKYNKTTYFSFNETGMTIKEIWIGDEEREYSFMYSDISRYAVLPTKRGLYEINFWANDKKIQVVENEKTSFVSLIRLVAGELNLTPTVENEMHYSPAENDIRKIIRDNTPLRSELDKIEDDASAITAKYDEAAEDTMGMIYITGPVKEYTSYRIILNGVSYFAVYPTKQEQILKEKGVFHNSKAEPHWIDNRTIAFKIPFGEWDISYSFDYEAVYHDRTTYIKDTVTLDKVHVTINKNHPIAKLKKKNKFFGAKLIEI